MQSLFLIEMRFYVGKCNIKEWRLYWSLSLLLECFLRDDDDELFLSYGWPRKDIYRSFHLALLSEILTIANLRHATSRVWTCAEPEFRLGWMKLRISDKHYTTAPQCYSDIIHGCYSDLSAVSKTWLFLFCVKFVSQGNSFGIYWLTVDSSDMVDSSESVREFFRNEILEAIPAIRKKNKRPDSKAIFSYIARNSATNVDESFIDKMLIDITCWKSYCN